jgi:hypothetical protein
MKAGLLAQLIARATNGITNLSFPGADDIKRSQSSPDTTEL